MEKNQTKLSKEIIQKLLTGSPITDYDFRFLRKFPNEFKNIKFIKRTVKKSL